MEYTYIMEHIHIYIYIYIYILYIFVPIVVTEIDLPKLTPGILMEKCFQFIYPG